MLNVNLKKLFSTNNILHSFVFKEQVLAIPSSTSSQDGDAGPVIQRCTRFSSKFQAVFNMTFFVNAASVKAGIFLKHFVILSVLIAAGVSCRHTEPAEPAPVPAYSEEIQEMLALTRMYLAEKRFSEAQDTLAPLLAMPAPPREAVELAESINQQRIYSAMDEGQDEFSEFALAQVEERLLMPETYSTTVVISEETEEIEMPPGLMEEMLKKSVSMRLERAGIKELVMALSEIDGLNVIADEALTADQSVNIAVQDVPLHELLSYIARNMGVTFNLGKNIIWITKSVPAAQFAPNLETQIYPLQHGFIPALEPQKDNADSVPNVLDNELEDALETFFANGPEGTAFRIYRDRNVLVARNTRKNLRLVETLLRRLDKQPQQVLIEARFITISQSDLLRLGLSLQDIIIPKSGSVVTFDDLTQEEKTVVKQKNGDVVTTEKESLAESLAERRLEAVGSLPGQLFLSGILGNTTYQAVLDAIKQTGSSRTLSAPRVTVANNRTAAIHRGEKRYYFEEYDLETIDLGEFGTRTQLVPVGNPKELDLGYKLFVKVNIGNDGETLMLALHPQINEFLDWDRLFGEAVRLPRLATNTLSTTVVVQSGETVVLGGTLTKSHTRNEKKIPFLGDIPVLGYLFRVKERSEDPQHLLIFVTANVIDGKGRYIRYEKSSEVQ